ncbi:MAG: hypothetical protein KGI49_02530 [Patescibacteria group bacterium]|nr:hypothetical protein [Patescibacteria group bacterium]
MYKSFTAQEFKKMLSLPEDYRIDGLLTYGAWDEPKHHAKLRKALDGLEIRYGSKVLGGFLQHALEIETGGKRYWFSVMYGGALLSEYLHLACLFGSKKNIHIGSCGGLYPEMESLDLLMPTWSYGNESTTRIYDRGSKDFKHYPDAGLSAELDDKLGGRYPLRKGPVVSIQAMMGETFDDVKFWSEQGYYGVEMETATVFSVSGYFGVPASALLYVSDNLIKGQTVHDASHVMQAGQRDIVKDEVYKVGASVLLS